MPIHTGWIQIQAGRCKRACRVCHQQVPKTTEVVKEKAALVSPNPAPDQATQEKSSRPRGCSVGVGLKPPLLLCLDLTPGGNRSLGLPILKLPQGCAITPSPSADRLQAVSHSGLCNWGSPQR